jgi:hypothetical protein
MAVAKHWTIDLVIDEHEDDRRTRAEARLHTDDRTDVRGVGTARRHPGDREVPEIGDELAAARALFDLAHRLLEATVSDIENLAHQKARVHV